MFQLVVAVIAIALVLLLTIAAIWFGGGVYDESAARASYARNVNSAAQIEGAMQLYFTERNKHPDGEDAELLGNLQRWGYLKDVPLGDWKVNPLVLYKPIEIQNVEQCKIMNRAAGYDVSTVPAAYEGCPPCNGDIGTQQRTDAETFRKWPGCQFISQTP